MTDDTNKLFKDLKEAVEIIGNKVRSIDSSQKLLTHQVSFMRDQQSVMNEKLDEISKTQAEHTDKIDALMAEIHDVGEKGDATYDLVKAIHEHDQRDIQEIKKTPRAAYHSFTF